MMNNNRLRRESKHFAFELALIFASVLIFRSAWIIMDNISWFNKTSSLILLLVVGIVVSVLILDRLFRHEKEHRKF